MLYISSMSDFFKPAPPRDRMLAAAIDFGGSALFWALLYQLGFPVMGMLLTSAYILFRDSLSGKSLGKRMRKLCAINIDSEKVCNWQDSFMRNLFLAVPILGFLVLAVEFFFAFKDQDYRRLGDHFAHTLVIDESSLKGEEA